jgi:hypothetical protein
MPPKMLMNLGIDLMPKENKVVGQMTHVRLRDFHEPLHHDREQGYSHFRVCRNDLARLIGIIMERS